MSLLDDKIKNQVREALSGMKTDVELVVFRGGSLVVPGRDPTGEQRSTLQLLGEVAALSERVAVIERNLAGDEEAQRLGLSICIHTGPGSPTLTEFFDSRLSFVFPDVRLLPVMAFYDLACSKIPERFPDLRWGFIEANSSWVPYLVHFLHRRLRVPREEFGPEFTRYPKAFYISDHTTAGYLDQRLAKVLEHDGGNIKDYLQVFLKLFPPGADYGHDKLHLRTELSEQERAVEPRNADSHLAFMGGGLRSATSSALRGEEPVWFVELDGVHAGRTRRRRTTVIAYSGEEEVAQFQVRVPASPHSIDAQNLRDPALGLIGQLEKMTRDHHLAFGRFDVSLALDEQHAGLTVNEYETLLMTHDLRDVLRDPLRFVAQIGREALQAPRAIPAKALNYAQYDAVQVFNKLMDQIGARRSLVEKVVNRALALPVSQFLRMKRGISLPVLDRQGSGVGEIGWGTYQSPILVQWKGAAGAARALNVRLFRFV
jgi:hypothetical protein